LKAHDRTVYVTQDGSDWLAIEYPVGLVAPPTLTLGRPLAGPVEFFYAECYRLPIPAEAKRKAAS
jgi:hypothetical protein